MDAGTRFQLLHRLRAGSAFSLPWFSLRTERYSVWARTRYIKYFLYGLRQHCTTASYRHADYHQFLVHLKTPLPLRWLRLLVDLSLQVGEGFNDLTEF